MNRSPDLTRLFIPTVRFLSLPSDFQEGKKGKTAGSRVKFMNAEDVPIMLHKPHPSGIMKYYQLKQIKEVLGI